MPEARVSERLVRGERVLFVSDVHLTPADPETFLEFCRFLAETASGAAALYILGDLFDFWVGPKQIRRPGYSEVFARIRRLKESGTAVYFQQGNRDFMLDGPFAAAQGLRTLPDVAETTVGGRRVLLTHGDLLCTRDHAYHRMRRLIRSRPARALLRSLPLRLSLRLAGGARSASGSEIRRKSRYVLDPDFEEAKAWIARGYDALIFGHVHRGERYRLTVGGREADIFILGSWADRPNYVEWDGRALELRAVGKACTRLNPC